MNEQSRIEVLRKSMLGARKFGDAWAVFFDLVGTPGFVRRGRAIDSVDLEHAVDVVCKNVMPDLAAAAEAFILYRHSGSDFIHGGFFFGGNPGNLMYFENERSGMAALYQPSSRQIHYCRFSAVTQTRPGSHYVPAEDDAEGRRVH